VPATLCTSYVPYVHSRHLLYCDDVSPVSLIVPSRIHAKRRKDAILKIQRNIMAITYGENI